MTNETTTDHPTFDDYDGVWMFTRTNGTQHLVAIEGANDPDDPEFDVRDIVAEFSMQGVPAGYLARPDVDDLLNAADRLDTAADHTEDAVRKAQADLNEINSNIAVVNALLNALLNEVS